MAVIDMQVHVWEAPRPGQSLDPIMRPHRAEPFEAEHLLAEMDAAGVDRALLVPPVYIGFDNSYCLEAARRWPDRLAVMGRLDPTAPGAAARVATWLDQPGMVAIRFVLGYDRWRDWLVDGTLDSYWPRLEQLGIPVAVFAPGLTRQLEPVVARHPGLTLIVDHLATPRAKAPDPFADLDNVLALVRYPGVYVKVSGLPLHSTEPYPFRDLEPHIRRVYDTYGPQRMIWGSDCTRMPCSYREGLGLFAKGCDFLTADDRTWILGRTAAKVLRWGK